MKYSDRIYKVLAAGVIKGYSDGIRSVIKLTKRHVRKFDDNPSRLFDIRWTGKDEELIGIFKKECFTVALIGEYELEEKIKELGVKVQEEMPEGGWKLDGKSITPQSLFAVLTRNLVGEYTGGDAVKIPPSGWLRTNLNTSNSTAYHAAEYQRLQQVSDIYPYYKYMTRADDRVRDEHAALHGKVFFHNDPIWDSIWPPNGWNCRCYVTPLTPEEVREEGTYVPPIESQHQKELIKDVPPDFRRNAGKTGHIFDKWIKEKLSGMPKPKSEEIKNQVNKFSTKQNEISDKEFDVLYETFKGIDIIKKHLREHKNDADYKNVLEEGRRNGLTDKETSVINSYTSRPFAELNKILREKGKIPDKIKAFEKLLNHSLTKLQDYKGIVYRGVGKDVNPENDFKIFDNYKEGMTIKENAFTSTSKGKNIYQNRNIEFKIKSKTGKFIESFSDSPSEHEVLFRSGTNFKIIKRYFGIHDVFKTKKLFIEMEEI